MEESKRPGDGLLGESINLRIVSESPSFSGNIDNNCQEFLTNTYERFTQVSPEKFSKLTKATQTDSVGDLQ